MGRRVVLLAGLLAVAGLLVALWVQSDRLPALRGESPRALQPVDVIVLIDDSTSMGGPNGTDPELLRLTAAHILTDVLEPGDRVAFALFSTEVSWQAELTEVSDLFRRKVHESLHAEAAGFTNLAAGLQGALDRLAKGRNGAETSSGGRRQAILVLTDGVPAVSLDPADPANAEQYRRLDQLASQARADGVRLYTILLDVHPGRSAQSRPGMKIMRNLAERAGSALPRLVTQAGDLPAAFLAILRDLKGINAVKLVANGELDVPPFTRGVDVLALRPYGQKAIASMRGPEGESLTNAIQAADYKPANGSAVPRYGYDLARVADPKPGKWQLAFVRGVQPSGWGIEQFDLQLQVEKPAPRVEVEQGRQLGVLIRVRSRGVVFKTADVQDLRLVPRFLSIDRQPVAELTEVPCAIRSGNPNFEGTVPVEVGTGQYALQFELTYRNMVLGTAETAVDVRPAVAGENPVSRPARAPFVLAPVVRKSLWAFLALVAVIAGGAGYWSRLPEPGGRLAVVSGPVRAGSALRLGAERRWVARLLSKSRVHIASGAKGGEFALPDLPPGGLDIVAERGTPLRIYARAQAETLSVDGVSVEGRQLQLRHNLEFGCGSYRFIYFNSKAL